MGEKFSLDRFEEIIECYFLPGVLAVIISLMFLDIYLEKRIFPLFLRNISFSEGLLFFILSLIAGIVIDSTRHLLFERLGILKLFGIPTIPRLDYFIDQNEIKISDINYELYKYFTRGSYYYAEFCGNTGLVLLCVPFVLEKFIKIYEPKVNLNFVSFLNSLIVVIALSLVIHYIMSMKTYVQVIRKLKKG
jgi:hypothetical protein